jgi:hypothetical protein
LLLSKILGLSCAVLSLSLDQRGTRFPSFSLKVFSSAYKIMESFLREGVDLQGMSGRTIAGDAHFFEDATTPTKVRAYLDSAKVIIVRFFKYSFFSTASLYFYSRW